MTGCNSCGNNRALAHERAATMQSDSPEFPSNLCELDEFKQVIYTGREEYTRMIPSPTGVIINYGAYKYGMGSRGSLLCVHDDDIKARPDLFEVIIEETAFVYTQEIIEDVQVEAVVENDKDIQVETVEEDDEDLRLLTRETALPITKFAEEYNYGHHINVTRAIKEGKLLKFKNDDGKTYVYHVES